MSPSLTGPRLNPGTLSVPLSWYLNLKPQVLERGTYKPLATWESGVGAEGTTDKCKDTERGVGRMMRGNKEGGKYKGKKRDRKQMPFKNVNFFF